MIRHGAPVPRRASVGKIPAAAYRSIVDMDWSRIVAVSVVDSVGGSDCTTPSSPFTSAGLSSEVSISMDVIFLTRGRAKANSPRCAIGLSWLAVGDGVVEEVRYRSSKLHVLHSQSSRLPKEKEHSSRTTGMRLRFVGR